jgi:hypothetical protein
LAALADPDRGFDAVVVGEYERAFFGDQLIELLPVFARHGVQLWLPETNGPVDDADPVRRALMTLLGAQSKREGCAHGFGCWRRCGPEWWSRAATWEAAPYGYHLVDGAPHPNSAHARWGRRLQRLEPDPGHVPARAVDLRPASCRAQRVADRARPQRPGCAVPVECGPGSEPPP